MNDGYDMPAATRFLGIVSRDRIKVKKHGVLEVLCSVPNCKNGFRNAPNIHYYKFPKNPDAPCISSSVRVTLRGTLTSGLLLSLQTILVVPVPARLDTWPIK